MFVPGFEASTMMSSSAVTVISPPVTDAFVPAVR